MKHDISKGTIIFVDYSPSAECKNPETYGEICVKCGECGRTFDENGVIEKEAEST